MSWNNPVATEGCFSVVRTYNLWCLHCGKRIQKGLKAFFAFDDKARFMRAVHPGCMEHEELELVDNEELHPHNVEDGMIG